MAKETFTIKTKNGSAHVVRDAKNATITEERTCYGFKEKRTTQVTKIDDECIHFIFGPKELIIETLKNS